MSEFCGGCGKDMSEYSDEEREEGWCISCAPELYEFGGPFGPSVDPLSGVETDQ
ncbi:MAG TPA: hypothetical protein VFJ06_04240 [Halococcus sp.]|nr:hypothetical protein [Halococcus sp.]